MRTAALTVLLLTSLVSSACSLKSMAVDSVADVLAGSGGGVYASDPDPELVGQALPFALKTIEALLVESPEHEGLLLAATRGFTQYAYGFVDLEGQMLAGEDWERSEELRQRALGLYLRARDYGVRGLEVRHPGIGGGLLSRPEEAVGRLEAEDVPFAYWTAAAWGAAISAGKDRPALLGDLPAVRALLERVLALDEGYGMGAVHEALMILEGSLPPMFGGSPEKARGHFERAVELAGGGRPGPFVAYAEVIAVRDQDSETFVEMLERALAIDPDRAPEQRLQTILVQRRARWLLERIDRYFLMDEEEG